MKKYKLLDMGTSLPRREFNTEDIERIMLKYFENDNNIVEDYEVVEFSKELKLDNNQLAFATKLLSENKEVYVIKRNDRFVAIAACRRIE